jgi:predicted nucleic acid-binding protein
MRVYLDVCCLQRPLDDRSQLRINIEAEAVLAILRLVGSGGIELISSEVVQFEVDRIPHTERKRRVGDVLSLASRVVELSDEIEALAESLVKAGLKPLDALHIASASATKTDYFCTCDDGLIKKSKQLKWLATIIVSPVELLVEIAP